MSNEARRILTLPFPARGLITSSPTLFLDKSLSPKMNGIRVYGGELRNVSFLAAFAQTGGGSGVTTLDNIPLEMFSLDSSDRTYTPLVGTRSKIYRWSGGGASNDWIDISGGATFTGTDTDPWSFAGLDDVAYFSNGLDGIWRWPGTGTIARVAGSPSARYLETFAGRIVAAHTYNGSAINADEVRWSGYLDPTSWDPAIDPTAGANFLTDLPGPLTGLRVHGGTQLLLYKRNCIFSMQETGLVNPAFSFRAAVTGVGCVAPRTIVPVAGRHLFLGEDNVYAYDGASFPTPIGNSIRPSINPSALESSRFRQSFAFHVPLYNEYWLCVPTPGSSWPNQTFVYNYIEDAWSNGGASGSTLTCATYSRALNFNDPWDADGATWDSDVTIWDVPQVLAERVFPIMGSTDKKTYQFSEANTIGSLGLANVFETADTDFGEPMLNKSVDVIYLTARPTTASDFAVSVSTDGGSSFTSPITSTWVVSSGVTTVVVRIPRTTGRYFRLRYECGGTFFLLGISAQVLFRTEAR